MKLCSSCNDPIPAKRLAAKPNATLCVKCQEQSESTTKTEEPVAYFRRNQIVFGKRAINELITKS